MNKERALEEEQSIPPLLRDLVDAASTQARVTNRVWLLLVVVSLLVVLPRSPDQRVTLPFELGSVEASYFVFVALPMLSVLVIAFCTSHAQTIRVQLLAYRTFASKTNTSTDNLDIRDLFDALRIPSVSRVAPLAQVLRGKHQFFPDKPNCPRWIVYTTAVYYVLLKILCIIVYLGFPAGALIIACSQYKSTPIVNPVPEWSKWFVWAFVFAAIVALFQTFIAEFIHIVKALQAITSRRTVLTDENEAAKKEDEPD